VGTVTGWVALWVLIRNEWIKFRARRRPWVAMGGVVILAGVLGLVLGSPSSGYRSQAIASDRATIGSMAAQLRAAHGVVRTEDRAQLLLAQYDLANIRHKPLPPLAPVVRATAVWAKAQQKDLANFTVALEAWQESRYALAHHLAMAPSWVPPTGLIAVSQVYAGNGVVLLALLAVLLTADVLGMESGTRTWNRVWLEPPSRWRVLAAKAVLATAVAVGTMLVAAVVLFVVASLRHGVGTDWATVQTHLNAVSVYSPALHGNYTFYTATKLSDADGISLVASDAWAVVGSLLPVSAVVAVAASLGYFVSQATVATLLGAGFAAAPILMGTGSAAPPVWLPGTYLDMGRVAAGLSNFGGSAAVVGASVALGLLVSVGWLALAWGAVAWHQRRAEV
jgi:hypothetical protein